MKKILLFIIIFSSSLVLAQDIKNQSDKELNKNVYGYVINGNRIYLVTDNGFLSVYKNNKTNKQWEDYYKKIYDDSTIVNPNTVIETNNNNAYLNYIIPVDVNKWINKKYSFVGDLHLYNFMQIDSSGNYIYRPGIIEIITKYKKNNKLVLPKKFRK